ncbi:SDR family oxidoreductase [bacterium]|nr:SDR family oxidoreductase [bacterium]
MLPAHLQPVPTPRIAAVELSGKVAIVTGAARRIGAEVARALAAEGAVVAVHYRSHGQAAKALAGEIGGRAFACDFSVPSHASLFLARVARAMGPVAVLVHNASLFLPGDLAATTLNTWQESLTVNLTAPYLLTKAFAAGLAAAERGVVVGIVDHRALRPGKGNLAYTVAEAGLVAMLQGVARSEAPWLRTGIVSLGPVLAPEGQGEEHLAAQAARTALGRAGTPAEVAAAVLTLCHADYMTGSILHVDGGRHLGEA